MTNEQGRFPQGKRGLKYWYFTNFPTVALSLPAREAWIEIPISTILSCFLKSLPAREAWIEIPLWLGFYGQPTSRFPQGKRGLKSLCLVVMVSATMVASRKGSVD